MFQVRRASETDLPSAAALFDGYRQFYGQHAHSAAFSLNPPLRYILHSSSIPVNMPIFAAENSRLGSCDTRWCPKKHPFSAVIGLESGCAVSEAKQ